MAQRVKLTPTSPSRPDTLCVGYGPEGSRDVTMLWPARSRIADSVFQFRLTGLLCWAAQSVQFGAQVALDM
jgi:hypothetical protein